VGIKQPAYEPNHSPPSHAEVKKCNDSKEGSQLDATVMVY